MSRTVCFIDKDGMCGTCGEESMGKDTIDCNKCSFKRQFEGREEDNFSYCLWKGELNQKQNVQEGVSNSDTLRTTQTPSSDTDNLRNPSLDEVTPLEGCRKNPQDCSRQANVADKEDSNKSVLPVDSKSKRERCRSYGD